MRCWTAPRPHCCIRGNGGAKPHRHPPLFYNPLNSCTEGSMALIQFVRNYDDLSTDRGFQFKFYCGRCGNGYETDFQANATAGISDMLDTASSIFGGLFN